MKKKESKGHILKDKELKSLDDGFSELLSVFEPQKLEILVKTRIPTHPTLGNVWQALQMLGASLNIAFKLPEPLPQNFTTDSFIELLAESSECRVRKMLLEANWWQEDSGALLCFRLDTEEPGVLVRKKSGYVFLDPVTKTETFVDVAFAKNINPLVYRFYRALPDTPLHLRDILGFIWGAIKPDLRRVVFFQFMMGILSLLLPIFTGIIFQDILPYADVSRLKQSIFLLMILTIVSVTFGFCVALYVIRIRFTSNVLLQSAIWDRVLRLPMSFFKQYNAGDLSSRVRAIDSIQQFFTSSMVTKLLSGLFAFFNLLLMFYYSAFLAWIMAGLGFLVVTGSIIINRFQKQYQIHTIELEGKIQGLLYQLISSIRKLRVANREKEAFGLWTKLFSKKNKYFLKAQKNMILYMVFNSLFMGMAFVVFFALVVALGNNLPFGYFLAFNVAFGQFFAGLFSMASIINRGLMVVPLYERVKPILEAVPETENLGVNPGILSGAIDIRHLQFRYHKDAPLVLEGISIITKRNRSFL